MSELVLASASPRRRTLLAQVGVDCEVQAADVDERPRPGEAAAVYVMRLARAKAAAVAAARGDGRPVLGADPAVVLDGALLGKPDGADDARRMLQRLSGREHQVLSAVALVTGRGVDDRLSRTTVTMRRIGQAEIARYCRGDEPYDKAGGYAIQGRAAAFVERIDGSYSGVVGLPLFETLELLRAHGVSC